MKDKQVEVIMDSVFSMLKAKMFFMEDAGDEITRESVERAILDIKEEHENLMKQHD